MNTVAVALWAFTVWFSTADGWVDSKVFAFETQKECEDWKNQGLGQWLHENADNEGLHSVDWNPDKACERFDVERVIVELPLDPQSDPHSH